MDIKKFKNKNNEIWLNVASSIYTIEGFINLDSSIFLRFANVLYMFRFIIPRKYHEWIIVFKKLKRTHPFIIHDCRAPFPFPGDSVDHILCSDFLEHVFPQEADKIIKEFYRILKKGGTLHVIVPNLSWMVKEYIHKKKAGLKNAADWFLEESILSRKTRGSLKYRTLEFLGMFGLEHRWMYDDESMELLLKQAGFKVLKENHSPSKNHRSAAEYQGKAVDILVQKPDC